MKYNDRATENKKPRPDCDLCQDSPKSAAAVDGKTRYGPWGYMCLLHHRIDGLGLGLGKGQVLLCGDDSDALLIEHYNLKEKVT